MQTPTLNSKQATPSISLEDTLSPEAAWDQLAGESPHGSIFMTSRWLSSWINSIGRSSRLLILRAHLDQALVGAAAFVEENGVIEFAGKGPSDYADILVSAKLSEDLAQTVTDLILKRAAAAVTGFRAFNLGRIQSASPSLRRLQNSVFYCAVDAQVETPRMQMTAAPEALRKKSLRRHAKGLEKRGEVTYATAQTGIHALPKLQEFFALHIARWADTDTPSAFLQEDQRLFFEELLRNLDDTGWLRFTEVRLDGELVAAHIGFLLNGHFTWYKPCYAPTLAKLSPGEVLIKHLIEMCVEENATVFDFTIGAEAFKLRFATDIPMVHRAYLTDSAIRFHSRRTLSAINDKVNGFRQKAAK
ncbi:MAG: GNAT family N-acetyltransferase [Pseudomonadota bacterium]